MELYKKCRGIGLSTETKKVDKYDVAAYLAERGMVAVPIEPNKAIFDAWTDYIGKTAVTWDGSYNAMIKAATTTKIEE